VCYAKPEDISKAAAPLLEREFPAGAEGGAGKSFAVIYGARNCDGKGFERMDIINAARAQWQWGVGARAGRGARAVASRRRARRRGGCAGAGRRLRSRFRSRIRWIWTTRSWSSWWR